MRGLWATLGRWGLCFLLLLLSGWTAIYTVGNYWAAGHPTAYREIYLTRGNWLGVMTCVFFAAAVFLFVMNIRALRRR